MGASRTATLAERDRHSLAVRCVPSAHPGTKMSIFGGLRRTQHHADRRLEVRAVGGQAAAGESRNRTILKLERGCQASVEPCTGVATHSHEQLSATLRSADQYKVRSADYLLRARTPWSPRQGKRGESCPYAGAPTRQAAPRCDGSIPCATDHQCGIRRIPRSGSGRVCRSAQSLANIESRRAARLLDHCPARWRT